MATITLGTLAGYWQAVYNWVTGTSQTYNPIVNLGGNNRNTVELTSTVLTANSSYTQGWVDTQSTGINYVSGSVVADQSGTLYVDLADDQNNPILNANSVNVVGGTPVKLSGTEISARYFRFRYVNGATGQATFGLYQTTIAMLSPSAITSNANGVQLSNRKTVEVSIFNNISITNTSINDSTPINVSTYGKKSFLINNTLNEAVTVTVFVLTSDGNNQTQIVQKVVNASSQATITSVDFVGLSDPFSQMKVRAQCSTAPTSGTLLIDFEGLPN